MPLQPQTLGDAYAIQQRVVDALVAQAGGRCIGYKVACTNEIAQAALQIDRPVFGRLMSQTTSPSGATLAADQFTHRVVEAEFALPRRQRRRTGRRRPHARHDRRAHRRAHPEHRDRRPPVRVVGRRSVARGRRQRDPRLVGPRRARHRLARPRPGDGCGVGHPRRATSSRPARVPRCSVIRSP